MRCTYFDAGDRFYPVVNDQGIVIASTSLSKGAKHTLGPKRMALMADQLCLGKAQLLVDLVQCRLDRTAALNIMETNCPPGTPRIARR